MVQWALLEGCYLTKEEFGKDTGESFWGHYLHHAGLRFSESQVDIWVFYVIPAGVLGFAAVWQLVLEKAPLFF